MSTSKNRILQFICPTNARQLPKLCRAVVVFVSTSFWAITIWAVHPHSYSSISCSTTHNSLFMNSFCNFVKLLFCHLFFFIIQLNRSYCRNLPQHEFIKIYPKNLTFPWLKTLVYGTVIQWKPLNVITDNVINWFMWLHQKSAKYHKL